MKEDLRVRRTKKLLRDSLYQLAFIEKRKLKDISVQDICELAMIHRSTFYKYYTDKYDLCVKEFYPKYPRDIMDFESRYQYPFQTFAEHFFKSEIHRLIMLNFEDEHFQERITLEEKDYISKDAELLLKHSSNDIPVDILLSMYSSLTGILMEKWIKSGFTLDPKKLDEYWRLFINPQLLDFKS